MTNECFPSPLFTSGQSETHYQNGYKDIIFPDGTIRHVLPSGEEKIKFSDGVTQRVLTNGDKIIDFPDGQRETHTSLYKVRIHFVMYMCTCTCRLYFSSITYMLYMYFMCFC